MQLSTTRKTKILLLVLPWPVLYRRDPALDHAAIHIRYALFSTSHIFLGDWSSLAIINSTLTKHEVSSATVMVDTTAEQGTREQDGGNKAVHRCDDACRIRVVDADGEAGKHLLGSWK